MSDRDGYNPHRPWHIVMERGNRLHTIDTYDTPTEVVAALMQIHAPERVTVLHVPTGRDGTGAAFLASVNRTFIPRKGTLNG